MGEGSEELAELSRGVRVGLLRSCHLSSDIWEMREVRRVVGREFLAEVQRP